MSYFYLGMDPAGGPARPDESLVDRLNGRMQLLQPVAAKLTLASLEGLRCTLSKSKAPHRRRVKLSRKRWRHRIRQARRRELIEQITERLLGDVKTFQGFNLQVNSKMLRQAAADLQERIERHTEHLMLGHLLPPPR